MLAEAVCKHMSFTYAPSQTQFWNHGYSTETDHIYVTTGSLAYDQLKRISEEVGNERTLLICCKAFMMDGADFPNLTLKKIPLKMTNLMRTVNVKNSNVNCKQKPLPVWRIPQELCPILRR